MYQKKLKDYDTIQFQLANNGGGGGFCKISDFENQRFKNRLNENIIFTVNSKLDK